MFVSQCRRQNVIVASTSYWSEKVSEEEHGARNADMGYDGTFYEECVLSKQTRTSFQKKA